LYPFGLCVPIVPVLSSIYKKYRFKEADNMAPNSNTQDETALERYRIISPILTAIDEQADRAKLSVLKGEACGQAGISRKTLARWLNRYGQKGYDGLKYREGNVQTSRIIPDSLVDEAIILRREVPTRSIAQIIEILELEGKVTPGFIKRSTLQDRLREKGYSSTQMKYYAQPGVAARRFARRERGEMWQADIKYGPHVKINGKLKQVFFVGFIDDATRYIVHGEFYDAFDQSIVEDCLRKAIIKEGVPQRLLFDNGGQFRNTVMERACAILGIKLIFAAPYSPETKGKIERFNRTLGSFIKEAELKRSEGLSEFNKYFNIWLSECYHNKVHEGIDLLPEEAYKSSKAPLRFAEPETLARAFLHIEQRKVDKSGCISFNGKKYEAGVTLIGRTVDIVYDPADKSVITVEDKSMGASFTVKELVIGAHTGPRPKLPEFMSELAPETSRLLDEKAKRYHKRQLSSKRAISYAQINKGDVSEWGHH
jgi:transposase InsO family protein